jgi:hypothetical protein
MFMAAKGDSRKTGFFAMNMKLERLTARRTEPDGWIGRVRRKIVI